MKLLKYIFFGSLFLFALSVIMTMYNMATEEETTLFGFPLSYYMVPLFLSSITLIFAIRQIANRGFVQCLIIWSIVVPLFCLINGSRLTDFIRVLLWPMAFFASYKLALIDKSYVKQTIFVFGVILVLGTFFFIQGKLMQFGVALDLESTNNAVFCVISVLPFALCSRNRPFKFICLIVCFVVTIFSLKRSALLILCVSIIPTLIEAFKSIKSRFARYVIILSAMALFVVSFIYLSENFLGNKMLERLSNISEDGGSGRDVIWQGVINAQFDSGLLDWLTGHGHYAVSKLGHASAAHNDFLEVLYDYGIIVFFMYIAIHCNILKRCYLLHKTKSPYFSSYFVMTTIFVIMSWVSILMAQQRYLIFMAVYWGIFEAINDKEGKMVVH